MQGSAVEYLIYLDVEFTNFESPQLLSLGMVTAGGEEFYQELDLSLAESAAVLESCSDFVQDTVLPQWGRVPVAVIQETHEQFVVSGMVEDDLQRLVGGQLVSALGQLRQQPVHGAQRHLVRVSAERSADKDVNHRRIKIFEKLLELGPDRRVGMPSNWRMEVDALEAALPHFCAPVRSLRNALALAEAKCRTIVRDRAHARAIAHLIPTDELFKNLGSPDGFGDWLFVNRTSFNGGNPLQQVRVYLNRSKHVSKRGEEFDVTCRQEADRLEVIHNEVKERMRIQTEAELAVIRECWGTPSIGIGLMRAVLELGLGRGKHFSSSRDGKLRADVPPSLILRELLVLLERFDSLDIASGRRRAFPAEQEKQLRMFVARNGAWLINVRGDVMRRMGPIGTNVDCVALCARALSRVPHIRTTLRPLLTQTQMLEKIGAFDDSVSAGNAPPARRSRAV